MEIVLLEVQNGKKMKDEGEIMPLNKCVHFKCVPCLFHLYQVKTSVLGSCMKYFLPLGISVRTQRPWRVVTLNKIHAALG